MGLTLRDGDRQYYYQQLDKHFPGLKERYINKYGNAYEIPSPNNQKLLQLLKTTCKNYGIICDTNAVFTYMHTLKEKKSKEQLLLF